MKSTIAIIFIGMMLFAACETTGPTPVIPKDPDIKVDPSDFDPTEEGLQKFDSAQEVYEFLQSNTQSNNNYATASFRGGDMVMAEAMAVSDSAGSGSSSGGSAKSVSTTNVQVQGVDEADFIKNDNKYIYTLSENKLIIVEAYPAEDAEVVSETLIEGRPSNIFLNEDKVLVFTRDHDYITTFDQNNLMPYERYVASTKVLVYDVSDRSDPDLEEEFQLKGDLFQARMINDYVYFITKESVYSYNSYVDLPTIRSMNGISFSPEIYYFPNPESNYVFHTVASINLNDYDIEASSYLMGYSNTLYVSEENMYVTYVKNYPRNYYQEENKERVFSIMVPLLPTEYGNKIMQYKNEDLDDSWIHISLILQEMFEEVPEKQLEEVYEEIEEQLEAYDTKVAAERQKTVIQKLSIKDGEIDYVATGEVKGRLHNQFSLDEFYGDLRVATTVNAWTRSGRVAFNNVYVLDENMELIGELEGIAEDETIFSTRFMGNRLYMVTFERIDPLFVIDLSNPTNPNILGELKIPGFSDYLHPYDEDHLIGVGQDADENGRVKGLQLSLFDVSDVKNPKQVDTFKIGGRGSYSEALNEHKAFLFDKEKNILVLPVREVDYDSPQSGTSYRNRYRVWQGAYAFGLTPEDGFELKGKISHESIFEQDSYWYRSPHAVRRSLFMDDVLYTVSQEKIMMNDIDTIDEINEVDLDYSPINVPYPVLYG